MQAFPHVGAQFERFSEDIDLFLDPLAFAPPVRATP